MLQPGEKREQEATESASEWGPSGRGEPRLEEAPRGFPGALHPDACPPPMEGIWKKQEGVNRACQADLLVARGQDSSSESKGEMTMEDINKAAL